MNIIIYTFLHDFLVILKRKLQHYSEFLKKWANIHLIWYGYLNQHNKMNINCEYGKNFESDAPIILLSIYVMFPFLNFLIPSHDENFNYTLCVTRITSHRMTERMWWELQRCIRASPPSPSYLEYIKSCDYNPFKDGRLL